MSEEAEAAPVGTGSPETGDSNFSTGGGGEPAAPGPTESAEPKESASTEPKPERHKTTFAGEEREWTVDELKQLASDEYRHKVKVGDSEEEMTYQDLVRNASLSHGAMTKMHQAAEYRKQADTRVDSFVSDQDAYAAAYAERNPDLFADRPSDYTNREWMAIKVIQERAKLDELKATDPNAFADAVLKRRETDRAAVEARKTQAAEVQQKQQTAKEQRQALFAAIPAEMEKLGMAGNRTTHALVGRVISEMEKAGVPLEPANIAAMARDYHRRDLRALVEAMDADGVEGLIGEGAAKKLREAAVKKLKAADKAERGPAPPNGVTKNKPTGPGRKLVDLRDI